MSVTPSAEQRLQDLRDWVVAVSGLADNRVLVAPVSTGPRPALPYATLTPVGPSIAQGLTPETSVVEVDDVVQTRIVAHRRSVYQLDVYGPTSVDIVEAVRMASDNATARASMLLGVVVEVSDPRYMPEVRDTEWESRHMCDITVGWVAVQIGPGEALASVTGTVTAGGVAVVVEGDAT